MSFTPNRLGLPAALRARVPKRNNGEHQHQVALFEWRDIPAVLAQYPALHLLQGSMNGIPLGAAIAGKAKAAGMLKGWPDVQLPVPRGGYTGLTVELKFGKNTATTEQLAIGELLTAEGWLVTYHWDWIEARNEIIAYLNLPKAEKTPAG